MVLPGKLSTLGAKLHALPIDFQGLGKNGETKAEHKERKWGEADGSRKKQGKKTRLWPLRSFILDNSIYRDILITLEMLLWVSYLAR